MNSDPAEAHRTRGFGFAFILGALLLFVGYPLSVGPISWLYRTRTMPIGLECYCGISYYVVLPPLVGKYADYLNWWDGGYR